MQRSDYGDLAAFMAVAEARSFTRAAAALGLSPSALSHALRGLEARLGVRLLARTTRSVAPTAAGERLLATLRPALATIDDVVADIVSARSEPSGSLRITTFAYAAETVLEPTLPAFLMRHPAIQLEISVDSGLTDIVAGGYDAGIRFGEAVAKDMVAVRVGPDLRTLVVGTPDYFRRHPPPVTPADLATHNCVGYRLPTAGRLLPWEFERNGESVKLRPPAQLVVNEGPLALAAVRAGAALGYCLEDQVAGDIAAGRLVPVMADWCPTFPGCHLYHSSRRQASAALRALIAALRWPRRPLLDSTSGHR